MVDSWNAETAGHADEGGVVLRGDDAGDQPIADVARPTLDLSGDSGGSAKGGHDGSDVGHGRQKMPTLLASSKQEVNIVDAADLKSPRQVGLRLKRLRAALGMGAVRTAAASIGVERTRWTNWESGVAIPPAPHMMALHNVHPYPFFNYLYLGRLDDLPHWLAERIQNLGR